MTNSATITLGFFISDDYDATKGIGTFSGITAAQYESTTITEIPV